MREALHCGDEREVEREPRMIGEGAYAALAEDHLIVTFRHYVLSREQEFFDSRGHPALEQYRFARLPRASEKAEVLHIAGADLDHLRVSFRQIERMLIGRLGHDLQAV